MLPTHLTQETENSLFTILQSYALLLKNMLETVTALFPDFSYLAEKYDLPKKQLNAILYATSVRPLILILVDIAHQEDSSTKAAAYADDFTAAGHVIQLKK